jgi:hypothetical protein
MVKNKNIYMNKLTAIDKSLLYGKPATVRELLEGLQSKVFSKSSKEAPITISTTGEVTELLTVVYKCTDCECLHLDSGYNISNHYSAGDVVYIDKSDEEDCVSIGEMISLIEEGDIDLDSPIIISCSIDNNSFPMTMLIKCSESCPSAHITFHVSNEIIMN